MEDPLECKKAIGDMITIHQILNKAKRVLLSRYIFECNIRARLDFGEATRAPHK